MAKDTLEVVGVELRAQLWYCSLLYSLTNRDRATLINQEERCKWKMYTYHSLQVEIQFSEDQSVATSVPILIKVIETHCRVWHERVEAERPIQSKYVAGDVKSNNQIDKLRHIGHQLSPDETYTTKMFCLIEPLPAQLVQIFTLLTLSL